MDNNREKPTFIGLREFFLFELSFNYDFIGGISYQWCVPPPVMDILTKRF